jgi:hypothetical protein
MRTAAVVAAALFLGQTACKGKQCDDARNDTNRLWAKVRRKASETKHQGSLHWFDLTESEKAAHFKLWEGFERQAELVEKSFAFEKITWGTAAPAKDTLRQGFDGYRHKAEYKDFDVLLGEASARYSDAEKLCK